MNQHPTTIAFTNTNNEVSKLLVNKDWRNTMLGSLDEWPSMLSSTLSIILNSQQPMLLFWGVKQLFFFNDAAQDCFGITNTNEAFGQPVALPALKSIIDIAKDVFATNVPHKQEEQLLQIEINGKTEERIYASSLSPVIDDAGETQGVLVSCTDYTRLFGKFNLLKQKASRFENLIMNATVAVIVLTGPEMIVEIVNNTYATLIGRTIEDLLGKPLFSIIPETRDYYLPILEKVRTTGEHVYLHESPYSVTANGRTISGFLHVVYQPYKDENGHIIGVMAVLQDITEQVADKKKMESNEQHLKLLSNTVPAMIFYLDTEQRYQTYNEMFMHWFGVKANEASGKTVREFLGELAYARAEPYLKRAYAGEQVHYEIEAPNRMDGKSWLSIDYMPHKDPSGKVLGIIVHASDISQRKESELALQESETKFRSLIEAAPIATCLFTGPEMTIAIANDAMIKVWGKDASCIGKTLVQAVPELEGQPFLGILDQVFATGVTYEARGAMAQLEVDGMLGTYYFDFTYKPLFDSNGNVYGIMDMAIDVTSQVLAWQKIEQEVALRTKELASANSSLQEMNSELQRSNRNLAEFVHAASHDLKEPIRKIHYYATSLESQLKGHVSADQVLMFDRISSASSRMGTLITDLINYAQLSETPPAKEPVDLNVCMKHVQEDLELFIQEKSASVQVQQLPVVNGYAAQLQQLLQNLLSNSIKYSRPDVLPVIIVEASLEHRDNRQYHCIKVTDNGIGFEQEYADKIFQVFARLHGKSEYSGNGVGLSIVRTIIDNHHGFIEVSSEVNRGSVFTVYLPADE